MLGRELESPAAQNTSAVIAVLVDAVAETHELALLGERALHPRIDGHRSVGAILVDILQHLHCHLVGAAVERTLERADAAANSAVHVGFGRSDGAAGESARVEIVLGVEHQRHIHDACRKFVGLLARDRPEQIRRMTERRIGINRRVAIERALARADKRGDLREKSL